MTVTFWGPTFPAGGAYWNSAFPDGAQNPIYFSGYGDSGSWTIAADIEGFQVTYSWITDIHKNFSGLEKRIAVIDSPKQVYSGTVKFSNDDIRHIRTKLALYMSTSPKVLLGLPHEELTLVADADGNNVFVSPEGVAKVDWAKRGQRVVVRDLDGAFRDAVIQDVSGGTISLDVAPGDIGRAHGSIAPAVLTLLDTKLGLNRSAVNVESFEFSGRAALFDFAPDLSQLDIGHDAFVTSRLFGLIGDDIVFSMLTGGPATGSFIEADRIVEVAFQDGVTTLGDIATLLHGSSFVKLTGSYDPSTVLTSSDVIDPGASLTGGSDSGPVGTGASLTMYDNRPVWDRRIQIDDTAPDSIQGLGELLDFTGVPDIAQTADFADWGRHVMIRRTDPLEFQWLRLFLNTVRGRQRAFWLPSYGNDFTFISKGSNEITVSLTDGSDFSVWWPEQRDRLQILQEDRTVTRVKVTAVSDNGDGTETLTIDTTLSASPVVSISWLELCRFEQDDFTVAWSPGPCFMMSTIARVVRQ